MAKKYSKKVTVSLTEDDFAQLNTAADTDRRSIGQYTSMLIEDILDMERKASAQDTKAKIVVA